MSRGWDPAVQSLKSYPGRTASPVGWAWRCEQSLSACPRQLRCGLGQSVRNKLSPCEERFLLLLKCGLILLVLCHRVCKGISGYLAPLFRHHHESYIHIAFEFSGHAHIHLNNLFVYVCVYTWGHFCQDQRMLCRSRFSPPVCGSGELNLAAGAFTHWSTSPALMHIHVLTWVFAATVWGSIILFSTRDNSWTMCKVLDDNVGSWYSACWLAASPGPYFMSIHVPHGKARVARLWRDGKRTQPQIITGNDALWKHFVSMVFNTVTFK